MSDLFDAADKLRREQHLKESKERSALNQFERKTTAEFRALTPMVVDCLTEIGEALYPGGFLLFKRYRVITIYPGQRDSGSHLGWHLVKWDSDYSPWHAKLSVFIDWGEHGFLIAAPGDSRKKHTPSRTKKDLVNGLKQALPRLL